MQRNYDAIGLILLTFFVISFLTDIIGPLVPDIIESFDLCLTLAGLLPFAFFISLAGDLLLALAPGYLVYIVSLFFIGSGMAMLQVAINPLLRVAGGAIIPLIVRWIGDLFGLKTGLFFLYLTLGYIMRIGFWSKPLINRETISLRKKEMGSYES